MGHKCINNLGPFLVRVSRSNSVTPCVQGVLRNFPTLTNFNTTSNTFFIYNDIIIITLLNIKKYTNTQTIN
jgi:hypothetical protein